jgi:hypothetical protein
MVPSELITCLEQRRFPLSRLRLFACARSAGQVLLFRGEDVTGEELTEDRFPSVDLALFSDGATTSRRFAPLRCARVPWWSTFLGFPHGAWRAVGGARVERRRSQPASRHHRQSELRRDHRSDGAVDPASACTHPACGCGHLSGVGRRRGARCRSCAPPQAAYLAGEHYANTVRASLRVQPVQP